MSNINQLVMDNLFVQDKYIYFDENWFTEIPQKAKKMISSIVNYKDTIIRKHQQKMKQIESNLRENGIDPNDAKKVAKKYANKLTAEMKSKYSSIKTEDLIFAFESSNSNRQYLGAWDLTVKHMREMFDEYFNQSLLKKIGSTSISVILLAVVVAINTFVVLMLGGGPAAVAIAAIFCAPLTEETAKFLSIKMGAGAPFAVIFNITEFLLYTLKFGPLVIPIRLFCVFIHLLWMSMTREEMQKGSRIPVAKSMFLHGLTNINPLTSVIYLFYRSNKADTQRQPATV